MSTLRFEQRTDKTDKQGKAPIRIVYQIGGQRKYFPTTLKCLLINWSATDQQAVFLNRQAARKAEPGRNYEDFLTEAETREFNLKLAEYQSDIADIEKRFALDRVVYTPSMVMEALSRLRHPESTKENPGTSVGAFIKQFVQDSTGTHKPGTLKAYKELANNLASFERSTARKASFDQMDRPFLRAFHSFLSEKRTLLKRGKLVEVEGMNNTTAAKQMSTLKTLLNYARTIYKINVHPDYRDYKVARRDSDYEVITLTEEEFLTLYHLDLSGNNRLAQVRDVFCFSCATGLRYSDLAQLKWAHIRGDVIIMTASKTGGRLEIPLNPYSAAILEKYRERYHPLPVISNQKTNKYIKELCTKAEINTPVEIVREYGIRRESIVYKKHELISIHSGRKTFITLSLEKGIAAQEVMALSGHSTFKAFKRYVEVTSRRKQEVMAQAWGGAVIDTPLKAV